MTPPGATSAELASAPRWSTERTEALSGRCRGKLLGPWGANLVRRYGKGAVARVRRRLPASLAQVPGAPRPKDWYPASAQVLVTEAIVDEFLGGDMVALAPLLIEDTRHASSRAGLAILRRLGPRGLFKMAPRSHAGAYDVGRLDAEVARGDATLRFSDAAIFGHPTWRVLQVMAQQTVLALASVDAEVRGMATDDRSFTVCVRW